MKVLKELKNVLEKEIEEISNKNDISPTELERLDKAIDILKDIEEICAMRESDYEEENYGYSGRYPYSMRDVSRTGHGYDTMRDASYRRGRDLMTGRYVSRDMMSPYSPYDATSYGYSGHASKEDLKMDLREMLSSVKSDKERAAIQTLLDQWKE